MKVLSDVEVQEYLNFFKDYYPIGDFKISVTIAKRKEWKKFFTWLNYKRHILQQILNDMGEEARAKAFIKASKVQQQEKHGLADFDVDEWKYTAGYFCPTNYLFHYINSESEENKKILMPLWERIKDSKWFVFLRASVHTRPSFNLTDREAFLLKLFHEILHIIEVENRKPVFRGSSFEDEVRDDKEIILPYVKEFIRRNEHDTLKV